MVLQMTFLLCSGSKFQFCNALVRGNPPVVGVGQRTWRCRLHVQQEKPTAVLLVGALDFVVPPNSPIFCAWIGFLHVEGA